MTRLGLERLEARENPTGVPLLGPDTMPLTPPVPGGIVQPPGLEGVPLPSETYDTVYQIGGVGVLWGVHGIGPNGHPLPRPPLSWFDQFLPKPD